MADLDTVRGTSHSARRTTATAGAKQKVQATQKGLRDPEREVTPQDSASNAPLRRVASGSHRTKSSARTSHERRTERATTEAIDGAADEYQAVKDTPRSATYLAMQTDLPSKRARGRASTPWHPRALLIKHTSAPLASRISQPPLASLIPEYLEPRPFHMVSPDVQESLVLDDILFTLLGYEGSYIRFVESYNPTSEKGRLVGPSFTLASGLDPSLRDLATTILEMAKHYSAVEAFIDVQSREEFGMINHALCASIRKLQKEYIVLIAKMEDQLLTNPAFTLHVLHLHILPTSQKYVQLYILAQEILKKNQLLEEDLDAVDDFDDVENILEQLREGGELAPGGMMKKIFKGGNVLRLLHERLSYMSGDPSARDLLQNLMRDASRPYMTMLNEWLHHGSIKDPHAEFLIKEQTSIRRDKLEEDYTDEYWEKRYTIRKEDVPPQLESMKDKILLAGKYLNVVRECGGVDVSTEVKDVPNTFDDPQFLNNVNVAYAHANSSLLNLLLTTHTLPARLRSMKHYFFLDRSDFFSYFLFLSTSELKKPVKDVNVGKLQSLLDLVLRQPGSVAAEDSFKEDVKIHMNYQHLVKFLMGVVNVKGLDQDGDGTIERLVTPVTQPVSKDDEMNGFEALEFKYSIPFPVSLVISSKTVVRYQILFRYLLSMRHLETLLVNCWEDHSKLLSWKNKSSDRKLETWKRRTWTLRARMLNFVHQFMYYCTSDVIEPNWNSLMAKVIGSEAGEKEGGEGPQKVSRTVDELMDDHVDFLDTCLKECMLMNSKLLKIHSKLLSCMTVFTSWTSTLSRSLCSADPSLAGSPAALKYLSTLYPSARHPIPDKLKSFDPEALNKMTDMLEKYEENFNRHLSILLDALDYYAATETVALGKLCARLSVAGDKGAEGGH